MDLMGILAGLFKGRMDSFSRILFENTQKHSGSIPCHYWLVG